MKRNIIVLMTVFIMLIEPLKGLIVSADSVDDIINSRIDDLYGKIGNTYWNDNHDTSCGKKSSGHWCSHCNTLNIVESQWFKNIFGSVSAYNFANSYTGGKNDSRVGWSCFGFANFAEWYIFKTSNSDVITTDVIGTYDFNYSNISLYAKVGDILRFDDKHSAIFISADANKVYVMDGNWSGSYNCLVSKHDIYYNYASTFTVNRVQNRSSINPLPPTDVGMICNYENMTVNPGTQIQLDFWYTNGDGFDIVIEKDGVEYERFNNVSSPFYYTPTVEGDYLARGYAKNSVGTTEANRRKFYIKYATAPTDVGMICNYENMTVNSGAQIQLDFWYTNGDSFDIVISKDGIEYERFNNVSSPFYYTPTEKGDYIATGFAKNSAGETEANRRKFYVETSMELLPDGRYSILSMQDDSYALNVYARDMADSIPIIVWQDPTQTFDVTHLGDGYYSIISSITGKALDIKGGKTGNDTAVIQYTWANGGNQRWKIVKSSYGGYMIVSELNNLCVAVYGGTVYNGCKTVVYSENSGDNQRWIFNRVDGETENDEPTVEIERIDTTDSDEYVFRITPQTAYENCRAYAVMYDDDRRLITVNSVPLETVGDTSISLNKSLNGTLAKIFVWNDDLQPLCDAKEITIE